MTKKSHLLLKSLACLLSSTPAFAEIMGNNVMGNCAPCRVEECCPEIDDCCVCNVCPPVCEITPNAGPCVKDGVNIYLTADFIYWTAREDNLEFAMTEPTSVLLTGLANPSSGRIFRPETRWRPGFKVGAGHDFCFDGWDIFAEYTWYRVSNTHKAIKSGSNLTVLDAYWFVNTPNNAGTNFYLSGEGKWQLQFNVVDFEVGRNFYVSPRLMLRPFVGLKGTWQKQKLQVEFNEIFGSAPHLVSMNNREKLWGVGILTGLNTSWHIYRSFCFFGNLGLSALWEQFKLNRLDNDLSVAFNTNTSHVNLRDRFHIVRPVIEWMLGLRWETWFSCDEYHFALEGGWEEQVWFTQNKFIRLPGACSPNTGDLTLQGVTIQARLDF